MKAGRLEATITVPTGGWTAAINDGTAFSATVAAGSYTPTELATAFEAACEGGSAATYSFTLSSGETGTGVFALTCTSAFTVTWTSTDLRDVLGFTGNLGSATTQTGTYGVKGMFLPGCPMAYAYPRGDSGHKEGGISQTVTPSGVTHVVRTARRTRMTPITWSHVAVARVRMDSETAPILSWERFVDECLAGGKSYFKPGCVVRVYWDADLTTYTAVRPIVPEDTATTAVDTAWRGLFACVFPGGWEVS